MIVDARPAGGLEVGKGVQTGYVAKADSSIRVGIALVRRQSQELRSLGYFLAHVRWRTLEWCCRLIFIPFAQAWACGLPLPQVCCKPVIRRRTARVSRLPHHARSTRMRWDIACSPVGHFIAIYTSMASDVFEFDVALPCFDPLV